jgi:hypothetical protein
MPAVPDPSNTFAPAAAMFTGLLVLGALATWCSFSNGWILYYGDAEAHLNIARRVIDSRTPGYEQIGTVWLPLPHVLMLPFVGNMTLWRTGLAGSVPGVICFALAGTALFAAVRMFFGTVAAVCAALLFALNPNLLYLQSTPMTEPVLFAGFMGILCFTVRFGRTQGMGAVAGAGLCSLAASLTRYEGWILIPFVCLYMLAVGGRNRWRAAILFGLIASAAPLYWFAHNQWAHSNALEFYNGPYSAKVMNGTDYPGYGDWSKAVQFYRAAAQLCSGSVVLFIGLAGLVAALWKRAWWPVFLLALVPVFYITSVHGSGTPIFVPELWYGSYYNTRYGMGVLPLLALGGAAIVSLLPERFQRIAATAIVLFALIPWIAHPRPDNWIVWKEGQVNSEARRAWTREAAEYLKRNYRPGSGILVSFGDLMGVLREAGIPLKESLHQGNGPAALGAFYRPELFLWEQWALAISADDASSAILKAGRSGPYYRQVQDIRVKGGPVIEIYTRSHDHPLHEGARRAQ